MTKYKSTLLLGVFAFLIVYGQAQLKTEFWPIGKNNFGILFPGPQLVIGVANKVKEACLAVSTPEGRLLFYSDGENIFDAMHLPMPNSKPSPRVKNAGQGIFTLKHPLAKNKYYLFYTNSQGNGSSLAYSILDMGLPGNGNHNKPLGDIKNKSKKMLLNGSILEAIGATLHENGKDIWIVIHERGNNTFRSFLVTENEILNGPVSQVGTKRSVLSESTKGSLSFSPNGKILAASFIDELNFGGTDLVYFDKMTGQITGLLVNIPGTEKRFDHYGVCFSTNGKLLYLTLLENAELIQYDLTSPNILKTAKTFKSGNKAFMGIPKIGPDGKLYVPRDDQSFLSVLDQPNIYGRAAGFREKGFNLPEMYKIGLGTPQAFIPKQAILIAEVEVNQGMCNKDGGITIIAESKNQPLMYSIDGGVSFQKSNKFKDLKSGNYFLEVKDKEGYLNMYGVVKIQNKNPIELSVPMELCYLDTSIFLKASPEGGRWKGEGVEGNQFYPLKAGKGDHKISYLLNNGCEFSMSSYIRVNDPVRLEILSETPIVCIDQQVELKVSHNQDIKNCKWSINGEKMFGITSNNMKFFPSKSQCYDAYFSAVDTNGCLSASYKEKAICYNPKPLAQFNIDKAIISTKDSVKLENKSVGGEVFEWDFGDGGVSNQANPKHRYFVPGNYTISLRVLDKSGFCVDSLVKEKVIIVEQSKEEDESYLAPINENLKKH